MHKQDLVEHVADAHDLTKAEAARIVNDIFDTISDTVAEGKDVTLTGFGTFKMSNRAARTGRNPQTGEALKIEAHTVPVFRAGSTFKNKLK